MERPTSALERDTQLCQRCGILMRLINNNHARLLLYWCPICQTFREVRRSAP